MNDVRVHPSPEDVAAAVADAFLDLVEQAPSGPVWEVALTGGSIARLIHREIASRALARDVDWERVRFWFGDERFVAGDSPDRNVGQAREDLLDHLDDLPATHVMPIGSTDDFPDVQAAADAYSATMRSEGTGLFGLVMLGLGPDGHVASLFPGHDSLEVDDQIALAETASPKPPPERVSLTFGALNRSERVWFVVGGADKADAVRRALAEHGSVAETPARGIGAPAPGVPDGPEITWWIDDPAASDI